MEQKFLEGTYASIFVYSGTLDMFVRAGAYREDFIQLAPLPRFKENVTNIAAWQYILNKSSANKEAAIRFLKYAASREGSIAYAEYMNRLPVRLDIIREEDLDIPGFEQLREYVENTELKERPFSRNTMEDIISYKTWHLKTICAGKKNYAIKYRNFRKVRTLWHSLLLYLKLKSILKPVPLLILLT